jgi:hypothetical protein
LQKGVVKDWRISGGPGDRLPLVGAGYAYTDNKGKKANHNKKANFR